MARILYFAWLRDAIGTGEEEVALLPSDTTPAALAERLKARGDGYATAFDDPSRVRAAVDLVMTPIDDPLGTPEEIAFFPPVTGG